MSLTGSLDQPFRVASAAPTGDLAGRALAFAVIGALVFNMGLCFVNTNVFRVNDATVMLAELGLIALTLGIVAVRPGLWFLVVMLLFAGYMGLILALRPALDLKPVRDVLIPIAFYMAARQHPDIRNLDRIAWWAGAIVTAFGLFEYLLFDLFIKYFNVIQYYVARGTVAAFQVDKSAGSLFVSGMRPEARNILPFLGAHRVSSVFLEPVSAGNFGAILYMWALWRAGMRRRWQTMGFGILAIVLSDSRFGLYGCIAATGLHFLGGRLPKFLWFALPFSVMLGLAIYGFSSQEVNWQDNIGGRLLWTARLLTSLDTEMVFGISVKKPFLSDSGYAYTLNDYGLVGFAALWGLFIFAPTRNRDAWRLKCQAATYFCLLMLVSDSPYSIKTAALIWAMIGAADGAPAGPDGRIAVGRA